MKNLFLISILTILLFSCQKPLKNVEDYFPQVSITAIANTDGTVTVKGEVIKTGASDMTALGFCFSDTSDFEITENQVLVKSISEFETKFTSSFDPTKTYYFKAFGANDYGRAESNVVALTGIESIPVVAPCNEVVNTYKIGIQGGTINTFSPAETYVNYVMYACQGTGLPFMRLYFSSPPLTGFYTTVISSNPSPGQVSITLSNGTTSAVNPGATVYVNRLSDTQFEVEVCDATAMFSGSNYSFKTHLIRNY